MADIMCIISVLLNTNQPELDGRFLGNDPARLRSMETKEYQFECIQDPDGKEVQPSLLTAKLISSGCIYYPSALIARTANERGFSLNLDILTKTFWEFNHGGRFKNSEGGNSTITFFMFLYAAYLICLVIKQTGYRGWLLFRYIRLKNKLSWTLGTEDSIECTRFVTFTQSLVDECNFIPSLTAWTKVTVGRTSEDTATTWDWIEFLKEFRETVVVDLLETSETF